MSEARLIDPIGTPASRAVHEVFMDFYRRAFPVVAEEVRRRYPRKEGSPCGPCAGTGRTSCNRDGNECVSSSCSPCSVCLGTGHVGAESVKDYEGAVHYRVQDILGAWLPAGLCANTSVTMNLRQWTDHLSWLLVHPLEEARRVGRFVQSVLRERYPGSGDFGGTGAAVTGVTGTDVDARVAWRKRVAEKWAYQPSLAEVHSYHRGIDFFTTVYTRSLDAYADIFQDRPRGEVLPPFLGDLGQCTASFLMSYRSWRDLERHRAGVCRVPLLTMEHGFAEWYLEQLPEAEGTGLGRCASLVGEATELLIEQRAAIETLTDDPLVRQYYTPMGYRVPTTLTYGLPAWVYVLETRTASTVHPEVRGHMLDVVKSFRDVFGDRVPLHVDESPDPWNLRRGMQTIERRSDADVHALLADGAASTTLTGWKG